MSETRVPRPNGRPQRPPCMDVGHQEPLDCHGRHGKRSLRSQDPSENHENPLFFGQMNPRVRVKGLWPAIPATRAPRPNGRPQRPPCMDVGHKEPLDCHGRHGKRPLRSQGPSENHENLLFFGQMNPRVRVKVWFALHKRMLVRHPVPPASTMWGQP